MGIFKLLGFIFGFKMFDGDDDFKNDIW